MRFEADPHVLGRNPITRKLLVIGNVFLLLANVVGGGFLLLKANSERERAAAEALEARRRVSEADDRADAQRRAAADERRIAAQRLGNLIEDRKNLEDLVRAQRGNLDAERVRLDASAQYALALLNENKALAGLKQKQAESDATTADIRRQLAAAELRAAEAKEKVAEATRGSITARKEVERAQTKVQPSAEAVAALIDRKTVLTLDGPINQGVMTHDAAGELPSTSVFRAGDTVTVQDKTDRRFLIVGTTGRTRGWLPFTKFHDFFTTPSE